MSKLPYLLIATLCVLTPTFASAQTKDSTFKRPKIASSDPYHNTDILIDGKNHTILPKRAILYIPENFANRVTTKRAKAFTIWPTFFLRNSSWLHTIEVTIEEAKGLKPIDPKRIERLQKLGKIIIAVHKRNPISILPSKDPNLATK